MRKPSTFLKQAPLFPCSHRALGGGGPAGLGGKAALHFLSAFCSQSWWPNKFQSIILIPSKQRNTSTHKADTHTNPITFPGIDKIEGCWNRVWSRITQTRKRLSWLRSLGGSPCSSHTHRHTYTDTQKTVLFLCSGHLQPTFA